MADVEFLEDDDEGPFALGLVLGRLMDEYDVTGYWLARHKQVPNAVVHNILRGNRPVVTWETVRRIADGVGVTPRERVELLNAWETDILMYRAASQCVYRLYEEGDPKISAEILDRLAARMAPLFSKSRPLGSYRSDSLPAGKRSGRIPRPPVPFAQTEGFERVRQLAELPAGHRLRVQLLRAVLSRTDLNWSAGESAFVPGPALLRGDSLVADYQNPLNSRLVRAVWGQHP